MAGNAYVRARNQSRPEGNSPFLKKDSKFLLLLLGQDGKAWQRVATAAANGRWQAPNPTASRSQLGHFLFSELHQTVGRVGADRVQRVRLALAQPIEAVGMENLIHPRSSPIFNYRRKTIKLEVGIN